MDEEYRKTLGVAAIHSNRFHVSRTTAGVRMAFGEAVDAEINYRAAVMLSDVDALALRDLLNAIFPSAEKQN